MRYKRLLLLVVLGVVSQPGWSLRYGENPDYPVYPVNMEEILWPSREQVCDAYRTPNKILPGYKKIMSHIDETYTEGDHRDFFFRYVLTMDCWAFSKNFFDHVARGGNYSYYLGSMMKSTYGGVDPNAYIRLWRGGQLFEGPLYHVFSHLERNYKDTEKAKGEYSAVMRRLNAPYRSGDINASKAGYFLLYPVKSLEQIRKEMPNMPISLP